MFKKRNFLILLFSIVLYSCSSKEEFNEKTGNDLKNEIKISDNFIAIQENKIKYIEFDVNREELIIDFLDNKTELSLNNVISFNFNGITYIRKIREITSISPLIIHTTHADLCDIFINGEFSLSSEISLDKSKGNKKNIFYPEKIIYENGDTLSVNSSRVEISKRLIDKNYNISILNEKYKFDFFKIEDGSIYTNLDFILEFNFNTKDEGKEIIRGQLLDMTASLVGTMGFNCNSRFSIDKSIEYNDEEKIDIKNFIQPIKLLFNVGGVSIPVNVRADLLHDLNLSAKGSISCSFGASYEMQNKVGVNYNQINNKFTPYLDKGEKMEIYPPVININGDLSSKYSLYPRFYFYIFDIVGPIIDTKPYINAEAGFSSIVLKDFSKQALNFRASVGLEMNSKIAMHLFSFEHDIYEMPDVELFNKGLYNSPHKIDIKKIDRENRNLLFRVYDTIPFLKKIVPTPLCIPVLFHSPSDNFYNNKITDFDGFVSIDLPNNVSCISGSIFKTNGEVIDNAVYGLCDAVDLGLSVLWCSHNYGVSNPEEFSEYLTHSKAQEISNKDLIGWRLPTENELKELCSKCKCLDETVNGRKGNKFIGPNGNSIFIPRMGYYEGDELIGYQSPYVTQKWYLGRYWGADCTGANDDGIKYYESLELGLYGECSTTDKIGTSRMPIRMVIDKEKIEDLLLN